MSNAESKKITFHQNRYWSCIDWSVGTWCGAKDLCFLAPQRDEYVFDGTQLAIKKWQGWPCCASTSTDYVDLKNVVDADVASTPPPCHHMICCGSRKDIVTVTTGGNAGHEKKELKLTGGEGDKVQKLVMRR